MDRISNRLLLIAPGQAPTEVLTQLRELGCDVTVASSGDALDQLAADTIDLVILCAGKTAAADASLMQQLRQSERLSERPIVLYDSTGGTARCLELGADDVLPVPLTANAIRLRLRPWLEQKQLRDRLAEQAKLLAYTSRLADDLRTVVLPLGAALSVEKPFERLLERVLTEAQALCNAEGGTFYLRTPEDQLKFAIVRNEALHIAFGGAKGTEAPFAPLHLNNAEGKPNSKYVAVHTAVTGQTVNIPDVYNASGFDFSGTRHVDKQYNYRTVSCLTIPLKNNENMVLGVLQLLNAKDRGTGAVIPFDSYSQQVVESLASQAAVALNNELLLERQKQFLRIERDLQIGRDIQAGFLPRELPQPSGWEIAARFQPAWEVGGDFYDVFPLSPGHVGLLIADVCNKGVGAALFMALFRSLLRALSQQGLSRELAGLAAGGGASGMTAKRLTGLLIDLNTLSTVAVANNYVAITHAEACMFATVFFGVMDTTTGELTYVNAGHDAPAVIGPKGVKERLELTGQAVGITPNVDYSIEKTKLDPGDMLFAYTDGVTEARSPTRKFFTERRLLTLLEEPAPSAVALLDRVESNVREFIATADPFDDITMLAVRRIPPGS